MKTPVLLSVLAILLFTSSSYTQWEYDTPYRGNLRTSAPPGWKTIYPYPTDECITELTAKDSFAAIITRPFIQPAELEFSRIFVTSNNGLTWTEPFTFPNSLLFSIEMKDSILYAAGSERENGTVNGVVYRSADLGQTWNKCLSALLKFEQIELFDSSKLLVFSRSSDTLYLFHSTDAGNSWYSHSAYLPFNYYKSVNFIDNNIGFFIGEKLSGKFLLSTSDGGSVWDTVYSFGNTSADLVSFSDSLIGFLYSQGNQKLSKTTDGGHTWNEKLKLTTLWNVYFLSYVDSTNIYFLNSYPGNNPGRIYRSSDAGETWNFSEVYLPDVFYKFFYEDVDKIWAAGWGGFVYQSADKGATWINRTKVFDNYDLRSVSFINEYNGWLASKEGTLYRTTDGGDTWTIKLKDRFAFSDINFLNTTKGFALSNDPYWYQSKLSKTVNGGESWTTTVFSGAQMHKTYFIDSLTGWIGGDYETIQGNNIPLIFKTTDGGVIWSVQKNFDFTSLNRELPVNSFKFFDKNNGWCAGLNGTIFKTTNGGDTWQKGFGNLGWNFWSNYDVYGMYFSGPQTGFLSGVYNNLDYMLLNTTDGGETWDSTVITKTEYLNTSQLKIHFTDRLNGFLFSSPEEFCYSTTDGGKTWNPLTEIKDVSAFSAGYNYIYAAGYGRLYKYTGRYTSVQGDDPVSLNSYYISQNYPNPFNPATTVRYSIPHAANVKIKIYDILGNEIFEPLNDYKQAGEYEITINAASLPSGVYFYVFTAGDYSAVNKFVLLK